MKNLNEITEIMEAIRIAALLIEPEDVGYIAEMMRTSAKFDKTYATAYEKMHNIFMYATPDITVPVEPLTTADEAIDKINREYGSETIVLGSQQYTKPQGQGKAGVFKDSIKHDFRSPCYTTRWSDIPEAT